MKYKRLAMAVVATGIVASFAYASNTFAAQTSTDLTDDQLTRIRGNCETIGSSLRQLHANDALTRVNRGRVYERVSNKLMTPLNSRIVVNRLDASSLVRVTSEYEKHLSDFRTNYQLYEESMTELLKIDCRTQPARFYDALLKARLNRGKVYESTQQLTRDAEDYHGALEEFRKPYQEGASS